MSPPPEAQQSPVAAATPRRDKDSISNRDKIIILAATLVIPVVFGLGLNRPRFSSSGESSAIASLKTLVTAEEQYKAISGSGIYVALTQLSASTPPYVDDVLGAGRKGGYSFVLTVGTPASANWTATARPVKPGKTGNRYFFVDSSGVVRFHLARPATSLDSPLD